MTYCPRCGQAAGDHPYCANCGAALASSSTPFTASHDRLLGSRSRDRSIFAVALTSVVAAAAVIMVALAVVDVTLIDDNPDPDGVAGAATPTESAEFSSTGEAQKPRKKPRRPAAAKVRGLGDVRNLAPGLFCRDLYADGYSYVAAVDYWRTHGQPNQMDEDRNGIPCQTVYTPADVRGYWGVAAVPSRVVTAAEHLPPGLFCRDLQAGGYSYSDAVTYWFYHSQPNQMDADLNGIPCETVYSSAVVQHYWR